MKQMSPAGALFYFLGCYRISYNFLKPSVISLRQRHTENVYGRVACGVDEYI